MKNLSFDYANNTDYCQIKNLLKQYFSFSMSKIKFCEYIKKHKRNILLLRNDSMIVACAVYEIIDDCFANKKIFFLRYLCVKLEFQNKGIGKIIINKIKQIANDLKVDAIELTCADFRQNSHKFYLANNFSVKKTKIFIYETFKHSQINVASSSVSEKKGGGNLTYINILSTRNKDAA